MGIVLKDILAILPGPERDEVRETSIYIEKDRIVSIGEEPAGFAATG